MNDSKDFQDAESIRSGNSYLTSQPVSFPPHPIPEGMLRHSFVSPSRREGPPSIWETHGISGNVFADASSSAPYPQELHQWNSSIEEPLHSSTVEKSERQEQNQDLRCQSGPSAKDSVILSGGDPLKNYGADQQRLQILDLHFDKFPTPATFACWKIRFKTEVCTCSQFPTEAMQWIKEVEMIDSVDDLRSSSSRRGISMPNFEVLDARIASALNKIIHNSHFKRRISLEEQKAQKQDRFLRGRQIAYLIYDYFRVTGAHDSVENYADLFTISLRNDEIQEFDSKWDGILLSMTKIPPDDILEGLYKLRIRESEKLQTVLELYDLEIHQKKLGPDHHRLKTLVKRSMEQDIRNKNFLGPEMEIMRRTPVGMTFEILVPHDVEEPAEFSKTSSQDRVQPRFGGKIIETPATLLAEKVVEVPVIQTEEKTRQGVNMFVQHVVNAVEVRSPKSSRSQCRE